MAHKSFKENPAMRFINQPETTAVDDEGGLAPRQSVKSPSRSAGPIPQSQDSPRINLAFSPDDFEYLYNIARLDGLSITEYLNRLISADRKRRWDEQTLPQASPAAPAEGG